MRTGIRYIILFSMLLFMQACAKEVSQEELVEGAVSIKLDQWRESQLQECRLKAYTRAEDYVDSLMVVISLQSKLDTIPKPSKPTRPDKPIFKSKPDSIVVKKIYKEE